jgi:hypothetical protein
VLPVGHLAVDQLADDLLAADLLASGYKCARYRANSRTGQCIFRHWGSLGKGLVAAAEAAAEAATAAAAAAVPEPAGQQGERGERGDQGTGILLGIRNHSRRWPSRPLLRIRSTSYGNRSSPSYSPSRRTTEGVEGGLGGDLFARLYCHCRRDRRCRQRDLRCEERFLSRKTSRLVFRSASERLLRGKEGLLYGWDQNGTIGCASAGRYISN